MITTLSLSSSVLVPELFGMFQEDENKVPEAGSKSTTRDQEDDRERLEEELDRITVYLMRAHQLRSTFEASRRQLTQVAIIVGDFIGRSKPYLENLKREDPSAASSFSQKLKELDARVSLEASQFEVQSSKLNRFFEQSYIIEEELFGTLGSIEKFIDLSNLKTSYYAAWTELGFFDDPHEAGRFILNEGELRAHTSAIGHAHFVHSRIDSQIEAIQSGLVERYSLPLGSGRRRNLLRLSLLSAGLSMDLQILKRSLNQLKFRSFPEEARVLFQLIRAQTSL
ncbi:MAG: hypothetical protein KA436_07370 [Oligoflexales bacterium]|nr:hypothetical protein [Oligoflexales bacterium]